MVYALNFTNFIKKCRSNCCFSVFSRNIRDFSGEIGKFLDSKFSLEDFHRRIYADEFSCFSSSQKNGFSANQVGVNRPVEDRWSAFRFGKVARTNLSHLPEDHEIVLAANEFPGGHLYTVIDGHGGHTCAHAVNLLHGDFVKAALSPPQTLDYLLKHLQEQDGWPKPCELAEQCWIRSRAKGHDGKEISWGPQGPWGSLDPKVVEQHSRHLKRFIEESLSTFDCEAEENFLQDNGSGDLCDPEGYVVIRADQLSQMPSYFNNGSKTDHINRISATTAGLRNGLIRLDRDFTFSAIPSSTCSQKAVSPKSSSGGLLNKSLLRVVMSGCVLSSIYVPADKSELYTLQIGDCGAVLGSHTPTASHDVFNSCDWHAELLVPAHTAQNSQEIQRILLEHPVHEKDFIFREDRLLGELMPFRAFGDIRLKWPAETLKHVASLLDLPPNYPVCPRFYQSPPYLSCAPQVSWTPLNLRPIRDSQRLVDKFVVLATDGLWDVCTPEQAVQVVATHLIDYKHEPWKACNGDTAASRLIRTALGGTEMDPKRIAVMLSVPANIARYYRDDISVMVVYLNAEL